MGGWVDGWVDGWTSSSHWQGRPQGTVKYAYVVISQPTAHKLYSAILDAIITNDYVSASHVGLQSQHVNKTKNQITCH